VGFRLVGLAPLAYISGVHRPEQVPVALECLVLLGQHPNDVAHLPHVGAGITRVYPRGQRWLLASSLGDDINAEGVESVGPDLLDLRYALQLLGNALSYFVGRGPVEREQQDLLGRGKAFMQGIPGLSSEE